MAIYFKAQNQSNIMVFCFITELFKWNESKVIYGYVLNTACGNIRIIFNTIIQLVNNN